MNDKEAALKFYNEMIDCIRGNFPTPTPRKHAIVIQTIVHLLADLIYGVARGAPESTKGGVSLVNKTLVEYLERISEEKKGTLQ